jgi:hypothetical protein
MPTSKRASAKKRPRRDESRGYIYFLRCPLNGLVKIGWTGVSPRMRLAGVGTMSPIRLEPIGVIPGPKVDEAEFHRRFEAFRSHGEWFRDNQELSELMAQLDPWDFGEMSGRKPVAAAPPESVAAWAIRADLTIRGVTRTVHGWYELAGLSPYQIKRRLDLGDSPDAILRFNGPPTWGPSWRRGHPLHTQWVNDFNKWRSNFTKEEWDTYVNWGKEKIWIIEESPDEMLEEDAW